jgi:hypothetical protein
MPVIRVSDEVMQILRQFAIPLDDTPDSVLRRILSEYVELSSGEKTESGKLSSRPKTGPPFGKAKQRYAKWIIASLKSQGGRARPREIIRHIEKTFGHEFTESERQALGSGKPRWIKNVNSARVELVKGGVLNKSEFGVWELTGKNNNSNQGGLNSHPGS